MVTGHAVDIETFKPLNNKKNSKKTILLSVGGLYKIKGHHLIIKALKKVVEKGQDAELWIVGDGYYKSDLINLSKKLNIENQVKFLGKKGHKELAKIYNMSNIFILANYQEITPAVNEALACKIPVVVMECGGRKFIIPTSEYGLISKKFDVDDMTNKITMLIENKNLADKIADKGRKYIIKNFSVKNVAEKIYKSLIE